MINTAFFRRFFIKGDILFYAPRMAKRFAKALTVVFGIYLTAFLVVFDPLHNAATFWTYENEPICTRILGPSPRVWAVYFEDATDEMYGAQSGNEWYFVVFKPFVVVHKYIAQAKCKDD